MKDRKLRYNLEKDSIRCKLQHDIKELNSELLINWEENIT